jgi:hypothetical protein
MSKRLVPPLVLAALALTSALPAEPVAVRTSPVLLNPKDPGQRVVGRLVYRGGLHLASDDPRFGGLSSIRVQPDGPRLVAVTDEGWWVCARLVHRDGRLEGVEDVEMGPLLGPDGTGRPDGVPVFVPPPPDLDQAPLNGGIEALVVLRGGALFALTEYWIDRDVVVGWTGGPDRWKRLGLRFEAALRPSDAAALPRGDILVLERAYNPDRGIVNVRVREIARSFVRPGSPLGGRLVAEFAPPLTLDNFEGIAAVQDKGGEVHVYLASDDNLSRAQRTLLLKFALRR